MTEKILHELYGGNVKVWFYPKSHRYKLDGDKGWLTSVTAVTGFADKSRVLMLWLKRLQREFLAEKENHPITPELISEVLNLDNVKRDEAADIGTQVHEWAEAYCKAKIHDTPEPEITEDMDEAVVQGVTAFIRWVNEHDVEFIHSERLVFGKAGMDPYVGTCDLIARVDGVLSVIDFKTSKGVYPDHYMQVGGYFRAYSSEMQITEGQIPKQSIIAHFDKLQGEFKTYTLNDLESTKAGQAFAYLLLAKNYHKVVSKTL